MFGFGGFGGFGAFNCFGGFGQQTFGSQFGGYSGDNSLYMSYYSKISDNLAMNSSMGQNDRYFAQNINGRQLIFSQSNPQMTLNVLGNLPSGFGYYA